MRCGSPCRSFRCRAVSSSGCWTPSLAASQSVTDLTDHMLFRRSWMFWSPPRRSTPTPPGAGRVLRSRRAAREVGAWVMPGLTRPGRLHWNISAIDLPETGLEPQVLIPCVVGSGTLLRSPTTRSTSVCCARPVRDGWRSTARRPRSTTGSVPGGSGERRGRGAGAHGVEASRSCGLGHHYCGAGHPA